MPIVRCNSRRTGCLPERNFYGLPSFKSADCSPFAVLATHSDFKEKVFVKRRSLLLTKTVRDLQKLTCNSSHKNWRGWLSYLQEVRWPAPAPFPTARCFGQKKDYQFKARLRAVSF